MGTITIMQNMDTLSGQLAVKKEWGWKGVGRRGAKMSSIPRLQSAMRQKDAHFNNAAVRELS